MKEDDSTTTLMSSFIGVNFILVMILFMVLCIVQFSATIDLDMRNRKNEDFNECFTILESCLLITDKELCSPVEEEPCHKQCFWSSGKYSRCLPINLTNSNFQQCNYDTSDLVEYTSMLGTDRKSVV